MASELRIKMQDAVGGLRESVPGCDLAVLIDPATGLVLCQSSETQVSQDRLDAVARDGKRALDNGLVNAHADIAPDATLVSVMDIGRTGSTVTLVAVPSREEALVCRFSDVPDDAGMTEEAKKVFAIVAGPEAA